MPVTLLKPLAQVLVASATRTTTGNSAALTLPLAESYFFILDCTASNTPTTLDVALQTSIDGGTTYYGIAKFTQITTGTNAVGLRLQPTLGRGEAASAIASIGSAATEMTAGSGLANNLPFTQDCRFRWVIVGTSYTFSIAMIAQPRDSFAY